METVKIFPSFPLSSAAMFYMCLRVVRMLAAVLSEISGCEGEKYRAPGRVSWRSFS